MDEKFPNIQTIKEEIISLEGDEMTERGATMRSLGNKGSKFRQENKAKGGILVNWTNYIKEKGSVINLELK